jgi:excisionase family DNA binding protein
MAARICDCHRETVYRAIRRGDLAAYRLGARGRLRIRVKDLNEFAEGVPALESQEEAS